MTTSVRDLQIGEMISISTAWMGPQKTTFLAIPEIKQLRAVQASYQAEAGNATQVESLAKNEFATLLGGIHITKDKTALDIAYEIGAVGKSLGDVEQQRSLAAVQIKNDAVTPSEVRRRMRDWAQVAEAILINLEIASAPAKDIDVLRQPLLDAVDKAITRRREKRDKREGAEGT